MGGTGYGDDPKPEEPKAQPTEKPKEQPKDK